MWRFASTALSFAAGPALAAAQAAGAPSAENAPLRALVGTVVRATDGRLVDPLAPALGVPRVLLFSALDCPVARRYTPEVNRLERECSARGLAFWLVFPDPDASATAVEAHRAEFALTAPALLDPEHALVHAARAAVTPEIAFFDAGGALLYHGRIDDRAVDFGIWRATATHAEAQQVLDFLGAGGALPGFAPAVGCPIGAPRFEGRGTDDVAFEPTIAAILERHCTRCHAPEGMAPFSFRSCADARKRADQIVDLVARQIMPPWKALPCDVDFVDENRLSPRELELLRRWASAGAPCTSAPSPALERTVAPGFEMPGRQLVAHLPKPWVLPPDGEDRSRTFVLPTRTEEDSWVRGLAVEPLNRRPMHHAILYLDPTGAASARDGADGSPGFAGMIELNEDTGLERGGWSPGVLPRANPEGSAWFLPAGSNLLLDVHMVPTGKEETIDLGVRLFLGDAPPPRVLQYVWLGIGGINLTPGVGDWQGRDEIVLPLDLELTGLVPHAHRICRRIEAEARLPDGRTLALLRIQDWDFSWQMQYRLTRPLFLPAGTRVTTTFVYDNSGDNPRNPARPPRRVVGGTNSRNEMGALWLEVAVPREHERALSSANLAHVLEGRKDLPFQALRQIVVQRFDADGDGTLDAREDGELVAWVRTLTLESPEVRAAQATFDADKDGRLDGAEQQQVLAFLAEWKPGPGDGPAQASQR